ncbi:glycine zipper 2TM domain-containing protein [Cupriavidus sp. H18C2]|uniref:glycine zipper 2TM domain-containing protein n=1 Tax=Cupriavidus sp. H18C2 TaxID=3241602 RepID=UPI003BF869C9
MSISIRPAVRTLALAVLAAGTLAGCAAPYGAGYGDGYGTGYQTGYQTAGYQGAYGNPAYNGGYNNGYNTGYGTSGTQISGAPGYPQSSPYPATSSYPQQPGYDQYGYPQPAQGGSYGAYDGASTNGGYSDPYAVRYGWVESIEQVGGQPANASGVGAVLGGVAGGLLGHQIGGGRGNTVATIGGAVAGALAGNEVEKRTSTAPAAFRVRVRTQDNGYLTLTQGSPYNMRIGDRVRIQNGVAMPY